MKFVTTFILLAGIFASTAHAHTFKEVDKLQNADAQLILSLAEQINEQDAAVTAVGSYVVEEFRPAQRQTERLTDLYQRVAKHVLHRDHPITGDEDGYDLGVFTAADDERAITQALGELGEFGESGVQLVKAVKQAADKGLLVLIGTGSGNNTMATILVVVDPATQEFCYLVGSNFGADS